MGIGKKKEKKNWFIRFIVVYSDVIEKSQPDFSGHRHRDNGLRDNWVKMFPMYSQG